MRKHEKIFWLLLIIIISVVFIFLGKSVKNRYFSSEEKFQENQIINQTENQPPFENEDDLSIEKDTPGEFLDENDKKEDLIEEKEMQEDLSEENQKPKESFLEIIKDDCENSCKNFSDNKEDFIYCQEVCGIKESVNINSEEECEDKEGLEEDYCLRDLAISQKNYAICEKIEDFNISKMCQNRITEEIFDNNN